MTKKSVADNGDATLQAAQVAARKRYVALIRPRPGTHSAETGVEDPDLGTLFVYDCGKSVPLPLDHARAARRDAWLRYRVFLCESTAVLARECGMTARAVRLAVERAKSRGPLELRRYQNPIPVQIFHGLPGRMQLILARKLGASWQEISDWFRVAEPIARELVERHALHGPAGLRDYRFSPTGMNVGRDVTMQPTS